MSTTPQRRRLTPKRVDTLARRWFWSCVGLLVAATALSMIGLRDLFLPLALPAWLCLARSQAWDGWAKGYKAAQHDAKEQP